MNEKMFFRRKALRAIIIVACALCSTFSLYAQITVSGTVTDVNDEPISGVSVSVKGTTTGTVTDGNGTYRLNVEENATIMFSYIGYITQEIKVTSQTEISVKLLEDPLSLEEVVVVGYGTQKKVNLTGAVAQIKGEALENRAVTNISQALQGQVGNLNITPTGNGGRPDATQNINIRGYTGFGSTAAPLVVIDGIQGGNINNVNMSDVENISVLKDAASAAIYGSSAPYGVILITTKRGKAGQKPTISYNNNFGWAQPINLPKMMNSLDWANFFNEACDNAGIAHFISDTRLQRIKDYLDGKITEEADSSNPNPGSSWGKYEGNANHDFYDLMLKDFTFGQRHNAGISGSASRSDYYVGLGYTQQDGLWEFGEDSFRRYNVRANLSSEIAKWFGFNLRSAFSRGSAINPSAYGEGILALINRAWPASPYILPTGEKYRYLRMLELGGLDKAINDNIILTGEFVVRPLDGWDITANYTLDALYQNSTSHKATVYQTMPNGSQAVVTNNPNSFSRSNAKNQHYTVNVFTSYEKQLKDHYFKAMVGYTQELYDNVSFSAGNNQLYSDELPSLALSYGTLRSIGEGASQLAIRGGFGRINYNFREKYLLELNGRYDGTSRFLEDVRNKFYPGVSAGWVVSKESFWEPLESAVNFLKFRVEYGSLGDQSFISGYYPFYPSLNTVSPTSSNWYFSGARESYISNPGLIDQSLTWITTTTLDIGADLAFLSNRLNVSFDWYRRDMDDYVGPAQSLPAVLGASAPQTNSTAIKTEGWELTVGFKDRKGDFSYGVNAVLSDYRGTVMKYPNPQGLNTTWYEGQTMGAIWGYETVGLFRSDDEIASSADQSKIHSRWTPGDVHYKDLNGDGVIDWGSNTLDDPGDRKVIGNTTPRYSFGVNMNAEYKGFDLNLFLQGVGKRDFWANDALFWGMVSGIDHAGAYDIHHDRWSESNPNGYFPKLYASGEISKNTQVQTRYLQNAAYMRVKNVQLGYSLPASLLKHIRFRKARIFVNVENLHTFTSLIKTFDPELSTAGSDGKLYPLQRTWSCGLNITF
jgi:TonB-linked SusC/RagA family outer membrane protein